MILNSFGRRRLRASQGGLWFVALTILVGLVAMASGNNVLYVIECFLLALFVISGLVSEHLIKRVVVTFHEKGSFAGQAARDTWVIQNQSWLPVFALTVGFKTKSGFEPHARALYLGPHQTRIIESEFQHKARGVYQASAIFVSTDAPFGFATKTRYVDANLSRLVWPHPADKGVLPHSSVSRNEQPKELNQKQSSRLGVELLHGQLEDGDESSSLRDVVWSQSFRFGDELKIRVRSKNEDLMSVVVDQRSGSPQLTELQISNLTQALLRSQFVCLRVQTNNQVQILKSHEAFNFLAQLPLSEAA